MFLPQIITESDMFMSHSIGLYLHIPFCKRKCAYCDFFSGTGTQADFDVYTNVLTEKLHYWGQQVQEPVGSVYFGGGTPSVLGTERLCALLGAVKRAFSVEDNAEITLEVNPESGKSLDFDALRQAGFDRVSVGMQSAIAREINILGRLHTPEEAAYTVRKAQAAGFDNTSLDLMLGIPLQTKDSLRQSIAFCADCGVRHISSYILKIEEGTPFYAKRKALDLPDEDEQAELYLFAVDCLSRLGYAQYEISNFAQPGFESRHNTLYWRCGAYIGIGPAAHSFYHGKRFHYARSMQAFCNDLLTDDGSGGDSEEYIMLALRLCEGLVFADYEQRFQKPLPAELHRKIEKYVKLGLMEADGQHACFTPKGFLVSNTILADLL